MPIYEYQCSRCGEFEVMQKISDEPLRTCPTCRRKVTKLISSTSFQLKGSGWYVTDYARKGDTEAKKSETAKSEPAKGEPKSESAAAKSGDGDGGSTPSGGKKKGTAKSTPKAAAA